jgi:two-component system, sensor histidine kinase LadS
MLVLQLAAALAALAGPLALQAASQPAFVLDDALKGRALGGHQAIFEDTTAKLSVEQVARGERGVTFTPTPSDAPGFGFSNSAAWLRFTVDNPQASQREWLLEFAYPHLDSIELYVPRADGGFDRRVAGDQLPFAQRDIAYRNVIFRLHQPSGSVTYYLRAHTSGSLTLPLRAWSPQSFIDHMNAEQPALWMFYGVLLAISLYNVFIFISVRHIAYFYYVAHTSTYALFQFVLNGLAYQYFWPDAVWWANQCMPTCIAVSFFTGMQFHRYFLDLKQHLPRIDRTIARPGAYASLLAAAASLVLPYAVSIRIVVVLGTVMIAVVLLSSAKLVLRRHRPAYFYALAWGVLLVGILAYLLKTMNLLPSNFATEWAIQIGACLEVILLSIGLADRINVMRRDLQVLNRKLGDNVEQLQHALERAEDARRAKSEFLANVSHELRTPLNTIINVPDGLREEFPAAPAVSCTHCGSLFELEDGETPDLAMACPECAVSGGLSLTQHHVYRGSPERSLRYLTQVVRSGNHLLEVVNDILDVSRLEAGQMTLHKQRVDMRALFERVIAPMAGLAERQGVALRISELPDPCSVTGDSTKLGQVFVNLVGNAIKFSDGKGNVEVSVHASGSDLVFCVRDAGIGISPHDQARIFESFVQAEGGGTRRFGGSGLGLAITKQLVVLHEGEIWVESELGRGSAFFVRLPASAAEHRSEPRISERSAAPARAAGAGR